MILGPLQFDEPWWLLLIPVLVPLVILPALKSMAGLSGLTRVVAVTVRIVVIVLLAGTLAEPHIRDEAEDVAVTLVLDTSKSISPRQQQSVASYLSEAQQGNRESRDRLGVVTTARQPLVQSLASHLNDQVELNFTGNLDASNIAGGMQLALAIMPNDAANRVLLASDGNETEGSLLQVAEVYRAAGIPIDVLPLKYAHEEEVIIDRLVAPATARLGQNVNLKVVLTSTHETEGRLSILQNGEVIDLDPSGPGTSVPVSLTAGTNTIPVLVPPSRRGPQEFEAVYTPYIENGASQGDSVVENNRSLAVTFVTGEARVLIISDLLRDAEPLRVALNSARIGVDIVDAASAPVDLVGLNAYDGVVMIDQSAYSFSAEQQEDLRRYVHDSGGGLLMIGGKNAFGAGGWIGSPLEDALPLKLDPPEKREMPRGALALIVHSVEIPQGVYYGKQVSLAAADALSRLDYIGITEYNMTGGTDWVFDLQPLGDKVAFRRAVNNLTFGDMPDFAPSLLLAVRDLAAVDAGQKHVIIISDGDPSPPNKVLLQQFINAQITISTVGIGVHNAGDGNRMKRMADATGGRHYDVKQTQLAELPKIFMKEAVTVRRNLIEEGGPFSAIVNAFGSEPMRGIGQPPGVRGYVVTADREGLSQVTIRSNKEDDPICAQWQYGLGRVVAYTSTITDQWAPNWLGWGQFDAFWEQHVRWMMRPSGNANVAVYTQTEGNRTTMIVEALDDQGERIRVGTMRGRLANPDGTSAEIELQQTGPGRWETAFENPIAGSYVMSMEYASPATSERESIRGTVQAAVTVPFADEYRALEDNEPLLRQVAAMTGGVVLDPDPTNRLLADPTFNLWRREGVTMPVATTSIWITLALIAVSLFLVDVGVRRVRLDFDMMRAWAVTAFSAKKADAGRQMESLQRARAEARERLKEDRRVASTKFEASEEQISGASKTVALSGEAEAVPEKPKKQAPKSGGEEGGMSRLMEAKRRAREGMDDET